MSPCRERRSGLGRPPGILGLVALAWLFAAALVGPAPAWAQDPELPAEYDKPTRHFEIDRPAELTDAAALTVYQRVLDEMVAGYSLSRDEDAEAYRSWRRYNKTPYRSATHGQRFVNNYANMAAKAYGKYEEAGQMPAGAVMAKDSFV